MLVSTLAAVVLRRRSCRRTAQWAAVVGVVLVCAPVAVRAAPSSAAAVPAEIVVTAQRLARPVAATASSLTALSAADLADHDLVTARDLAQVVPNLVWQDSDGASVGSVYLRGIGSPSIHSNQLGAVGLYADDVTLSAPLLANLALLDLERVEVVRGPWNAGLGRNASGGAVRFVSRAPVVGEPADLRALLRAGTHGRFDAEAAAGLPLGERAALRVALAREALGDYIDNATLARDEGGHARTTARLRLRVEDDGGGRLDLSGHGAHLRGDSIRYKQIGRGTPGTPGRSDCAALLDDVNPGNGCVDQTGFADTAAFHENFSGLPSRLDADVAGASLRIERPVGAIRFTSLTAFEHGDSRRAEDTDGGPSYLFVSHQQTDSDQWSQDLQLASSGADSGWRAGLALLQERAHYTSLRRNPNPALTPALVPGVVIPADGVRATVLYGDLAQRTRHASLWLQADHALGAATRIAAEARLAREVLDGEQRAGLWVDRDGELAPDHPLGRADAVGFAATSVEVAPGVMTRSCPPPFALTRCYSRSRYERRDTLWGARLTVEHRLAAGPLVYASVARGVKGARVSPIARDSIVGRGGRVAAPERVLTYEIGAKAETPGRRLRIDASAFLNEWRDYQLFLDVAAPPAVIASVLTNLPRARTWGGELELDWTPSNAWRARLSLGYTRSAVRDAGEAIDAQRGSPLIGVPRVTANGSLARHWRIGGGRLSAQLDAAYTAARRFSLDGDPALREPGYVLVDASLRYRFAADERVELSLWGRNLGATRYCVRRQSLGGLGVGDAITCQPNEGRRFLGVAVALRVE